MKNAAIYYIVLAVFLLASCGQDAQQTDEENKDRKRDKDKKEQVEKVELRFPALSPRAEVKQVIGITPVKIDYSRPSVRDREIWGSLVPYNEMWRTGADAPTTIKFGKEVTINGQTLEAGTYSLLTIPAEDGNWTIIINESEQGTRGYDEDKDVIRFESAAESTDQHHEMMTFAIENVSDNSGRVVLAWENLKTGFDIEVDTDNQVMALIEKAIDQAGDDNWETYNQSAGYLISKERDLDQAEEWLNTSLEIKETWRNCFNKGRLMEARGNHLDAIEWLEKAIEVGNEEDENFGAEGFLRGNIERLEEDLS